MSHIILHTRCFCRNEGTARTTSERSSLCSSWLCLICTRSKLSVLRCTKKRVCDKRRQSQHAMREEVGCGDKGGMAGKIWDISQRLGPMLPVWPGDTAFTVRQRWTHGAGSPVNVASFELSTHSGAHADAPLHYDSAGAAIDQVALEPIWDRPVWWMREAEAMRSPPALWKRIGARAFRGCCFVPSTAFLPTIGRSLSR